VLGLHGSGQEIVCSEVSCHKQGGIEAPARRERRAQLVGDDPWQLRSQASEPSLPSPELPWSLPQAACHSKKYGSFSLGGRPPFPGPTLVSQLSIFGSPRSWPDQKKEKNAARHPHPSGTCCPIKGHVSVCA
jgi:hypothetical protein